MGWDDGFVIKKGKVILMQHTENDEGVDTSYIHQSEKIRA